MSITEKNLQTLVQGIGEARHPRRNEGKLLSKVKELQEQLHDVKQKFEIEKNAKNQAYFFIIATDYLEAFRNFCNEVTADDWHKACIDMLLSKSKN